MRHALAVLVAVLGLGFADARADQTDPRLVDLFEKLRTAPSPEAAAPVEAEIWTIWAKSGDSDLDQVLKDQATAASEVRQVFLSRLDGWKAGQALPAGVVGVESPARDGRP